MDVAEIKKIMDVLNSTDVSEITLEADGTKVSLKKGAGGRKQTVVSAPPSQENVSEQKCGNEHVVLSKNVGKIYFKDKKGNKLVSEGDKLENGQIIGYVKAVGISSDVVCDVDGVVKEVLVKDGDNVEYSQKLLTIEKE